LSRLSESVCLALDPVDQVEVLARTDLICVEIRLHLGPKLFQLRGVIVLDGNVLREPGEGLGHEALLDQHEDLGDESEGIVQGRVKRRGHQQGFDLEGVVQGQEGLLVDLDHVEGDDEDVPEGTFLLVVITAGKEDHIPEAEEELLWKDV